LIVIGCSIVEEFPPIFDKTPDVVNGLGQQ